MRLAFLGTRGVPARYSGFETCVEEVGSRLVSRGHEVVVYVRDAGGPDGHHGMELVYRPSLRLRSGETLSHAILSAIDCAHRDVDAAVVFNVANSPAIPLLRRRGIPVVTHLDGLEWERAKWGRIARTYLRWAARRAARWSDALVADARAIQRHYREGFGVESVFVPYGAPILRDEDVGDVSTLGLEPRGYHLVVARLEPENNVHLIIDGYERSGCVLPLVVVGDVHYRGRYQRRLVSRASDRVRFVGWVWDQRLLNALYRGADIFVHGHSVGGTNPSLLRAMGAGAAVVAYDTEFNREVIGETGEYFFSGTDLARALARLERSERSGALRTLAVQRVRAAYDWSDVAASFERLLADVAVTSATRAAHGTEAET